MISNRKKDNSNNDATGADVSTGESRVIVRTTSESGIVNDGYRWRKYGQKMVKGNTNPRYTLAFIMNWYILDPFKMHYFISLSLCAHKFMKRFKLIYCIFSPIFQKLLPMLESRMPRQKAR